MWRQRARACGRQAQSVAKKSKAKLTPFVWRRGKVKQGWAA
ncbi:hypothetical protein NYG89_02485 [Campylobacter felis]|nr:hypothetical protein [Campylobacter felis]